MKNKKDNTYEILGHIVGLLIVLAVAVGSIALSAWIFNAVMASDMPDWLKYILLK
jgi:hypothetical protein